MKTPMQELIDKLNNVKPTEFCSIETIKGWAESMLEKEKHMMEKVYYDAFLNSNGNRLLYDFEEYCNETY